MLPRIAVVGATGAVGEVMRQAITDRKLPFQSIKFLASAKSAGKPLSFQGKPYILEAMSPEAFEGIDIVLASTPSSVSREWSPRAVSKGAIVIDNSSAWRMDPDVPLVVPEVNADTLLNIPKGIVANPNCATIQMVVALRPLQNAAGLRRVVLTTFQASSGKGARALDELNLQIKAAGGGSTLPAVREHATQLFGNVISHDWKLGDDGYSEEEWKIMHETRKILGLPELRISATTVRVPVRVGHSESLNVEMERPLSVTEARELLKNSPGIILKDEYASGDIPVPLFAEGKDEVFVGRIRKDFSVENGLNLWVVADNLRKGAASNAVQIAETLIARKLLKRG